MCDFARAANHHRLHPVTTREGIPASMTTRMEKKNTPSVSVSHLKRTPRRLAIRRQASLLGIIAANRITLTVSDEGWYE